MNTNTTAQIISTTELLAHWQGHRSLTRRVIEAFPEKELFEYSIGGMRTFSGMVMELLGIGGPGIKEIATGNIGELNEHFEGINTKEQLLQLWDEASNIINTYWEQIPEEKFGEEITIFGQYKGSTWSTIFYFIDNEIHHRGEAYVYLRSMGITPPFFYERP
ncbi:DinB family protein [Pedobacter gandavensis]|uniref:DinB family protein n=1 Tax=Pedobacter gandavensis TaxID=2679963 RepID=UPI00292D67A2|nr:DinB family protein [Pedobacter gandavensis]